jgi:putative phosphoribosyl transferase
MRTRPELGTAPIGCLGVGPGAAVVLRAAESEPRHVDAVVVVAGWTELVDAEIPLVQAPTLLIEGSGDRLALDRAWRALRGLGGDADVKTILGVDDPMATVSGRIEVAELAGQWFRRVFAAATSSPTWRLAHAPRGAADRLESLFL